MQKKKKYLNKKKQKKNAHPISYSLFNFLVLKKTFCTSGIKKKKEKNDLSNNKKYEIEI